MKTVVYMGGAGPVREYRNGVRFTVGEPVSVDDEFADELLRLNMEGLTVPKAEPYGIPVFVEVTSEKAATAKAKPVATDSGQGGEDKG